jgi:thermitase
MLFYLIAFLATLVSLSLWFRFQHNDGLDRLFRSLFFVGLAVYMLSLGLAPGPWSAKWPWLLRDLGILAVVPVAMSFLRISSWLYVLILLGLSLLIGFGVGLPTTAYSPPAENEWELLVEVEEGLNLEVMEELIQRYDLKVEPAFQMGSREQTQLDDFYSVEIPERFEPQLEKILEDLVALPGVEYGELNEAVLVAPDVAPPTVRKSLKKLVNDPDVARQWGFESMRMDQFYRVLKEKQPKPRKKALVAILDTGVDGEHEDLEQVYRSTQKKYDKDVRGHGTHCAGIAAAVSNNGKGIASFSWKEPLYEVTSIKVLSDFGAGSQRGIIQGMLEAADLGADVISMSLGGRANASRQRAYEEAVRYANSKGAIVVVAAGNDGMDARQIAPANVNGVITVSAIDTLNGRASFSNSVEHLQRGIAAPGVTVFSTLPGNKYAGLNGTSMATPHVAGLLACLKSFRPDLTTDEAYQVLHQTGTETRNPSQTGRLIQPGTALQTVLLLR